MKLLLNVVGILLVLAISWLISWDRKSVKWTDCSYQLWK